jgi:hypothetical protein
MMTPEEALENVGTAINNEQWDKATAYATAGLLAFAIGAAKSIANLEIDND